MKVRIGGKERERAKVFYSLRVGKKRERTSFVSRGSTRKVTFLPQIEV